MQTHDFYSLSCFLHQFIQLTINKCILDSNVFKVHNNKWINNLKGHAGILFWPCFPFYFEALGKYRKTLETSFSNIGKIYFVLHTKANKNNLAPYNGLCVCKYKALQFDVFVLTQFSHNIKNNVFFFYKKKKTSLNRINWSSFRKNI